MTDLPKAHVIVSGWSTFRGVARMTQVGDAEPAPMLHTDKRCKASITYRARIKQRDRRSPTFIAPEWRVYRA